MSLDFRFLFDVLDEEQKSLVALMKEFCEREVDRKALDKLADRPYPSNPTKEQLMARIPWDIISKAHDIGLRQVAVPEEYGGGGYGTSGWVTCAALAEAAGYYGGPVCKLFTNPWKHCAVLSEAPKEVQDEFFPAFMKNRRTLVAASTTEPDHGTDLLLPYDELGYSGTNFAYPDGDYWVINGEKMFCTCGGVSDYIVLTVRTDREAITSKSLTTFLFPTNTPGWSIVGVNDMMGNEIADNVQMHFDNCKIHKRLMMSKLNEGWKTLSSGLTHKNIHHIATLGTAVRAWEDMKEYAKTRVQGGKPIIQHTNVGTLVAEGDVLLRTARLLQYQFAWECDHIEAGTPVNPLGWFYNNYWSKVVFQRLVAIGLEVYGGMAPMKELSFERWARVTQSILHGGSTGLLSLVKGSRTL